MLLLTASGIKDALVAIGKKEAVILLGGPVKMPFDGIGQIKKFANKTNKDFNKE